MEAYPKKTCSIDRLVTHPKLVAAAKAGMKTQQRRDGVYGLPGETFDLEISQLPFESLVTILDYLEERSAE